jgi:hypothetical protein
MGKGEGWEVVLGKKGGREVGEMIPICYVTDNGGQVLHGLLLQY